MRETETRLTAEEAQIAGKVPTGHVWDEEAQTPVPRGSVPVPMDHFVGTSMTAEEYKARRENLLRFVKTQLTEAEYNEKGYPTRVNDYYRIGDQLALSKKGGELLGQLYSYKIRQMECTVATVEKEFCSATYRCTLHRAGIIVAVREGSCNTAERKFQSDKVKRKYAGDFRAAENDIRARAQKRAFVNAMIVACAASDIFAVADEQEIPDAEYEVIDEGTEQDPRVALAERLVQLVVDHEDVFSEKERTQIKVWAVKPKRTVAQLEEAIALAEERLMVQEEMPLKK